MKIKKWLPILSILFLLCSIQPLPLQGASDREFIVRVDTLNVREGPGLSYPIISQIKKGEKYSIIKVNGEWYEIDLAENKRGWVASWLVDEHIDFQRIKKGKITVDASYLRTGPNTTYPIKGLLEKGAIVYCLDQEGEWYEVHSTIGKGWIHQTFIEFIDEKMERTRTVTADILNVRKEPSLDGEIIGKLTMGEKITIQKEDKDWLQINYEGEYGWIHKNYVAIEKGNDKKAEKMEIKKKWKGIIAATSLHMRDEPSFNGKRIALLKKGDIFPIIEQKNNWYKIEYKPKQYGWVASWYVELIDGTEKIMILSDGTNIRSKPSKKGEILSIADGGSQFPLISIHDNWYEIELPDGRRGFVASWVVTFIGDNNKTQPLLGKKILIDPGHGGKDNGTTGYQGTLEKNLTLKTAQLLYEKLQNLGASVFLTRHSDQTISLYERVKMSHYQNVDAFISIHYDSIDDESVEGMTTYYFYPWQKPIAAPIHYTTVNHVPLKDRGVRFGNYYVLRENRNLAVLLELGFLSNPEEEQLLLTNGFQENITTGIAKGIVAYFQNH